MLDAPTDSAAVILAAGQGTRMKSKLQKVLHPVAGKPMVEHVLEAVAEAGVAEAVLVVGRGAAQVYERLGDRVRYVEQGEQLGTGHAALQARATLADRAETILVLCGDTPLIQAATLRALLDVHRSRRPAITMLTARATDPTGYGRIVRDDRGQVRGIVEEASASVEQKAIGEVNSGIYCFRGSWLWSHLDRLEVSPKGEYYLTDLVGMAAAEGEPIEAVVIADPLEAAGINDRVQLAEAERVMRRRVRERLMRAGVTMIDPATCYVDATVAVGRDTVLQPNTTLRGLTVIGEDCEIGPGTLIEDTRVGDRCRIVASVLEGATLEDDVVMGPFSRLRPGAHLAKGVEMGNFGEVKKSYIGPGTKMHHFSYVGDATFGADVNIGAGTITCNYDSETKKKNETVVEDEVGLGSDTMLVAPVRIGARSTTGAGSVVTHDLPADSVAYGVPASVKRTRGAANKPPA
ncbi:MAG: bifunctional UDP-N-acetylglucosamine diphosphorylase/glucosamine-1-phosphate N-acetyltransferase GlmU [Dehalococcoidales bacterium]|nr:bifunctional UDP-N-acetylglucosamine diphosphorylase/glucosamine-1-phosphate N-acetyltransferase GlmU [Dehalococcoidales bacterium]